MGAWGPELTRPPRQPAAGPHGGGPPHVPAGQAAGALGPDAQRARGAGEALARTGPRGGGAPSPGPAVAQGAPPLRTLHPRSTPTPHPAPRASAWKPTPEGTRSRSCSPAGGPLPVGPPGAPHTPLIPEPWQGHPGSTSGRRRGLSSHAGHPSPGVSHQHRGSCTGRRFSGTRPWARHPPVVQVPGPCGLPATELSPCGSLRRER